jgi:hypothetical protein
LTATVNLLNSAERHTRQIVALTGDHRGDEAVVGDLGKRNTENGFSRRRKGRRGFFRCERVEERSQLSSTMGERERKG